MRRLKIHAIVAALLLAVSICAADMFLNRPGSLLTDRTTGALVKLVSPLEDLPLLRRGIGSGPPPLRADRFGFLRQ